MSDKGFDLGDAWSEEKVDTLKKEERILKEEIKERRVELKELESVEKKVEKEIAHEKHATHHTHTTEQPPIDLKNVWKWVVANKALFLILIPLLLSIYVRTGTEYMPITEQWAANNINNFINADIRTVVDAQYPNLPQASKDNLVNQQMARATKDGRYSIQTGQYRGQTMDIKNEINNNAAQLKQYWQYDLNGKQVTYMPDIDPYFYTRYARNYIEKGMLGDIIDKEGDTVDNHMLAPNGKEVSIVQVGILPKLLAWNHKVFAIFNKNTDILQTAAKFPLVLAALAVIPAFFIGRRLAGDIGGVFAGTLLAVNTAAVGRTLWGHPDTDGFNLLFPMVIVWMILEALRAKTWKARSLWAVGAGFVLGSYSLAWSGWWYLLDFILGAFGLLGVYIVVQHWRKDGPAAALDPRKNTALAGAVAVGLIVLIMPGVFNAIVIQDYSFSSVISTPFLPFEFSSTFKEVAKADLWPNVYTTVAELNPGSVASGIEATGGKLYFVIAIIGIVMLLCLHEDNRDADVFTAALLTLWFIGSFYAVTKGIRFTALVVPVTAIGFGVAIGKLHGLATKHALGSLRLSKVWTSPLIAIVAFLLLLPGPIALAKQQGAQDVPIMNDAWFNALTHIKDNSEPDAIINSWWDFGHHFKFIADRAVTFDGASQNNPQAHWIGLVLTTDKEDLAKGILRMLDCGGKRAVEYLDEQTIDTAASVKIIKNTLTLEREAARKSYLAQKVEADRVDKLLSLTHCEPPEDYFITSDDMIGKAGVWGHFGLWNFERSYTYVTLRDSDRDTAVADLMKTFNYSEKQAENQFLEMQGLTDDNAVNAWIAPWPNYISGPAGCASEGSILACGNGVQLNASNGEALVQVQGNVGRPQMLAYVNEEGKFTTRIYNDSTIDVGIAIAPNNGGFQAIIMSPELTASMFTRMYFFKGHGLEYFTEFNHQQQLTGGDIYVWKVDWAGHAPNKVFVTSAESEIQKPKEEKAGNVNESSANTASDDLNTAAGNTNASAS